MPSATPKKKTAAPKPKGIQYLIGFSGWGSLENLHLTDFHPTPEAAIEEFMGEVAADPYGVLSESTDHGWADILVYPLDAEQAWRRTGFARIK